MRQSELATQYVKVPVSGTLAGVAIDVTTDAVRLAAVPHGSTPVSVDWKTGDWETADGETLARLLIGPDGDLTLTPGLYDVWVEVTDSPETPVLLAGEIRIF